MGKHKKWRAQAKKMRRKRIRQKSAQERDQLKELELQEREKSPRYQAWVKEQEELETFQEEEEARLQRQRHLQWEQDEIIAQQLWQERQERMARAREERAQQEMRIREEWEAEQKRLREVEEERQKKEMEKKQQQEELMRKIDEILKKGGELPSDMITTSETHPDKPQCPFFSKTGACRFGDWCSRNHVRPSMSKVLLIPNFYSHFGLEQALVEEYDTDVMLEYADSETYQHFKDFFQDVLPEFQQHGRVVQFKVCRNFEPHLRGNVYVEYAYTRDSVAAYKTFQGRWYGGRQLSVEFTCVSSWRSAICGLYFKQRCPKGRSCNFLHVFRNPGGQYDSPSWRRRQIGTRQRHNHHRRSRSRSWSRSPSRSPSHSPHHKREKRNWRWSESPEPEMLTNGQSSEKKHERRRTKKDNKGRENSRSNRSSSSKHSSSHRKKHRRRSPGSS